MHGTQGNRFDVTQRHSTMFNTTRAMWRTAAAAEDFLRQDHDQPCFLARTIYRPYWSWYTRCEFFELHPRRQIQLPPTLDDDRSDVPARGHVMAWEAPLVAEPMTPWPYPAVVTHSPQWYGVNDAVRSKSFIASGVETAERKKLYDMDTGLYQWNNLASEVK